MAMAAPTAMNMSPPRMSTERHILMLMQWLSPAYPVGAFAYSHGLETVIQSAQIATAQDLQAWLEDVLQSGSGHNDCILLYAAYRSDAAGLDAVDAAALAVAASAERQLETRLQGAAFGQTTAAVWGGTHDDHTYPVAVGAAAARMGISETLTAALYLQAFASNLVSAAVRAVPLGQTEGQTVLAALTPLCERIAQETQSAGLDELQSTAFVSDIAAMQHETLQPRIFRS